MTAATPTPAPRRCAIYTRKSTTEGLEQAFNTLDAQRDACDLYARSQGWRVLPARYDDGGFTGANLDRPALARLLAAVQAGQVDGVLVYKIDRLSRSLFDFATLAATFERHRVGLVAVTQHFDTTSSMGRLTLNMLLSFAQFEREMIAERTRDKLAAARRRGQWTGGVVPLGYDRDPTTKQLVVNAAEAETVRTVFDAYQTLQSALQTAQWLNDQKVPRKPYTTTRGKVRRTKPWDKQEVQRVLHARLYVGELRSKDEWHPGAHPALLDRAQFDAVQALLGRPAPGRGRPRRTADARWLLRGLLTCAPCGRAITPASTRATRHRYYVCNARATGAADACPTPRLPAASLDQTVLDHLRKVVVDEGLAARAAARARAALATTLPALVTDHAALVARRDALATQTHATVTVGGAGAADVPRAGAAERTALEQALAANVAQQSALRDAAAETQTLADLAAAVGGVWRELRPAQRRDVVQRFLREVRVDAVAQDLALVFRPPLDRLGAPPAPAGTP